MIKTRGPRKENARKMNGWETEIRVAKPLGHAINITVFVATFIAGCKWLVSKIITV